MINKPKIGIYKFKVIGKQGGFTLVELIIAIGLFSVIAFISLGALLSIYDANRKSQSSKTVVDNLNISIENMTRDIRFGSNYYCGISSDVNAKKDCNSGGDSISVTFNTSRYTYRKVGTAIQRSTEDSGVGSNITSPDTVIEYLRFYVINAESSTEQPYVVAVIEGYVGSKPTVQSSFSIQTLMSQRSLNI